uniref:Uncharacterized protein n=2 Tax=Arion vulgaris TaxID=1028688 RepID=A0A0B7AV95_9EUPU
MPKNQGGKSKKVQSEEVKGASSGGKQEDKDIPVSSRPDNSIIIKVLAKPGAKQNSITGLTSEGVGVQISAPPVEGEANTELVKYIAKTLGIRKSDICLDQGSKSRTKILLLDKNCGLSVEAVIEKLQTEAES